MKQKLGSIGKPVPGHKVKLMNREGDFVKSEEEGQIVVPEVYIIKAGSLNFDLILL